MSNASKPRLCQGRPIDEGEFGRALGTLAGGAVKSFGKAVGNPHLSAVGFVNRDGAHVTMIKVNLKKRPPQKAIDAFPLDMLIPLKGGDMRAIPIILDYGAL